MQEYTTLLAVLLAVLFGLTAGKAWERYKLQEGRLIDRRKLRHSPHYLVGLNFLVSSQIDQAIEALTQAASADPGALELQLILGNLYREKGQVGRAVQVHQALLQVPRLSKQEHAHVLLCLGLDFKRGGFVDRALEAFREVLHLDPGNHYALLNLQKLHEEQHQWAEAYEVREQIVQLGADDERPRDRSILAFLDNEIGMQALRRMDYAEAAKRFERAIEQDRSVVPAHLNLGDVRFLEGRLDAAAQAWEGVAAVAPERAYLAFDRLASLYPKMNQGERFPELCRRLVAANPQDWRARLALARHQAAVGKLVEALELLFEALVQNPHALALHQTIWQTLAALDFPADRVGHYMSLTRDAVFYLDPHVCVRCRYRSTELLWQCPHCHEWNTFVEERIAPAKESDRLVQ
jgi:lipopolysaccharide biosynthesis regulator YciM